MLRLFGEFFRRIGALLRGSANDRDLQEEMQFHLDLKAKSIAATTGAAAREARSRAQRSFGNQLQLREASRDAWGWSSVDRAIQDLRYAVRGLRRNPGFTLAAITTLALGIGANAAVFSILNAVLLKPLPYRDASRLLTGSISLPDFADLQQSTRSFDELAVWASNQYTLRTSAVESEQVLGALVSDRFFPLLQNALFGRTVSKDDQRQPVVVISYAFWQTRMAGVSNVLGQTLPLSGKMYTIIGVMPPEFQFPNSRFQLWVPLEHEMAATPEQSRNRALRIFRVLAHMRPDSTPAQVQAEMITFSTLLQKQYPDTNAQVQLRFIPIAQQLLGNVSDGLKALMGAAALVLLVACANVANLLLARGAARSRELSVRAALGAGRWRIVRQLLTESLALASAGTAFGLGLASFLIRLVPAIASAEIPRLSSVQLDTTAVLVAIAASVLAGLLFGLVPALQVVPSGLDASLRENSRGSSQTRRHTRFQSGLIVAEIALAFVVVIGAGLLLKSLNLLLSTDTGFTSENLVTASVPLVHYNDPARRAAAITAVLDRLRQIPGVQYAGGSTGLPPLTPQRGTRFAIESGPLEPGTDSGYFIAASPDYFPALGAKVFEGRGFTQRDTATAPKVAIINDRLAKRLFPGKSALGERVKLVNPDQSPEWRTIVGVVSTVRYSGLDDQTESAIYTPFDQTPFFWMYVMVRHAPGAAGILPAIRRAVTETDPNLTALAVQPMETLVSESAAQPRFRTLLLSGFAALAFILAGVGIYGVVSYSVTQRFREMGVRIALGATPFTVFLLVVGASLKQVAIALLIGVPGAWAATRYLKSILFEVRPEDPVVVGAVASALAMLAVLASYFPARRAMRADPAAALRDN